MTTLAGRPIAHNQNSITAGPRGPVLMQDGHMRFDRNGGGSPVYEPNSFGGPMDAPAYREPLLRISGDPDRWEHREDNEDYQQAGDLYRLISEEETARLVGNIVGAMQGVPREIQLRQVRHFYKADPAYGEGVAKGGARISQCSSRDGSRVRYGWLSRPRAAQA